MLAAVIGGFSGAGDGALLGKDLDVGDMIWPELDRRIEDWEDAAPFAECSEFIEAFLWRRGELARERGPLEELREDTCWRENELRRERGFRGVDGFTESGDLGGWEPSPAGD